jgi:hypothetical protein
MLAKHSAGGVFSMSKRREPQVEDSLAETYLLEEIAQTVYATQDLSRTAILRVLRRAVKDYKEGDL